MEEDQRNLEVLSERVIGSAFEVLNTLGTGFLEKVYENALAVELRLAGLDVVTQAPLMVWYRDEMVGRYFADIVVDQSLILELRHAQVIDPSHIAQCINYLKATGYSRSLTLNFGNPRLQIKRVSL